MTDAVPLTSRPPTGGVPSWAVDDKRWFLLLGERIDRTLRAIADDDPHERPCRLDVSGADADAWRRWWRPRGAQVVRAGPLDLAVDVDATARAPRAAAREHYAGLLERLVPGGRMLVVERVVGSRDDRVRGTTELLELLTAAAGTALTLAAVESHARPGERHRSTISLELIRLRGGGDG